MVTPLQQTTTISKRKQPPLYVQVQSAQ